MPGFNYGGYGDGTGWSSESGGPAPGGGMHGNSGGQRGDNANSSNSVSQQISAIQNDQKLKQKVVNMLIAARKMNPEAKMILGSIAPSGVMAGGAIQRNVGCTTPLASDYRALATVLRP